MVIFGCEVSALITECILDARGQEICGCFLQDVLGNQKFCLCENRLHSNHGFFVSEGDWKRVEHIAHSRRMTIMAFVHSHSGSLEPSKTDRFWMNQGDLPWIIVALDPKGILDSKLYMPRNVRRPVKT